MAVKYNGIEKYIFGDVYNLFLKYKDVPDEDYYFECLINDVRILNFKYDNHPLVKELTVATMNQLEHVISKTLINGMNHDEIEDKLKIAHKIGW